MNTLHVRQVPDDVYEALKARAKERDTSISSETIRLLRRALAIDRAGVRELLDEIEAARPRLASRGALSVAGIVRRDRDTR
jgi:plasmid stability protein